MKGNRLERSLLRIVFTFMRDVLFFLVSSFTEYLNVVVGS